MQLENDRASEGRRVRVNDRARSASGGRRGRHSQNACFWTDGAPGCSQEVIDAKKRHLYQSGTGQWFVRVPEGKGDKERSTPTSPTLAGMIRAQESGVLVDVSTRTIRRWVDAAAEQVAEEEYDERWRSLGPHDLRRTWGHLILEAEVLPSVVMQWGGWKDYPTFQRHYLGKHGEVVQSREAAKVEWL